MDLKTGHKPLFERGSYALARVVVVAVLSVVLMTADHRGGHVDAVRSLLATLVYPLQYAVDLPIRGGKWVADNLSSRRTLMTENERLRRENFSVQSRLERYAELEAENRRLRELLDSAARVGVQVLIAERLAVDLDPNSRRIVLNKGIRDGVHVGQSLIDANGIMGQVVEAGPFSSSAVLITDPSHALPVQVRRSGLLGIAVGTGPLDELELTHVPVNADVLVGDVLVTSGLGGRFPAGYPVGRVVSVERDSGRPFAQVTVESSANLERNREVLLVWSDQPSDRPAPREVPEMAEP
jgi:rod shape-determining protein MreC